jgi:hypothetical protein
LSPVAYLAIIVTDVSLANTNATFELKATSTLSTTLKYPTLILTLKFQLAQLKEDEKIEESQNFTQVQNFSIVPTASKQTLSYFSSLKSVPPFESNGNLIFLAEEFAKIVNVTWF